MTLTPPPAHPRAEDVAVYRAGAIVALDRAIQRSNSQFLVRNPALLDACNAIGDYTIARMRWMDDHA